MAAGGSAGRRSRQLHAQSEALFELAASTRKEAHAYAIAASSEASLSGVLRPLTPLGWTVLEDRLWPGSKRANVDFVLVGPGGIVVLDAKHWSAVEVRDDSLFRGESCEDDELEKLHALVDRITEAIDHTGLTNSAVSAAMVFTNRPTPLMCVRGITLLSPPDIATWLARLPRRFESHQVAIMAAEAEVACPEMPSDREPKASRPATPRAAAPQADLEAQPALVDADTLAKSLLEAALAKPIEDWMTFLHPEQNRLIRSQWNGPARVRGPAGTGKTVVGLHRAVYIAERAKRPVLFVSYVRTLPKVLSALARRMSESAADNIEFMGVHQLAHHILDVTDRKVRIDLKGADRVFSAAWRQSGARDVLGRVDERPAYWREEIDHVIKGRGLKQFEEYRNLSRVGRRTRIGLKERECMWDLYVAYEAGLSLAGAHDFNDLLIRARDAVDEFPGVFRYSSVIIDEVQDLNLVGLKFLASLADGAPHSLLLIGDGQQSVYPGGFNLSEAGISVSGRASVLQVNYRNTAEILEAAAIHVTRDEFNDLDDELVPGTRAAEPVRHGNKPIVHIARTQAEMGAALVRQLERTVAALEVPWGDLAVLLLHRKDAQHYLHALERAGIPTVELTEYDGITSDRVKVGTVKRSKGLEFKYVLMPALRRPAPDIWPGETDDSYEERCERIRRELYVGMTRARDGLWLGYFE